MNEQKLSQIVAGTLAGWAIVTVGQPLDYIKTLYQIRAHHLPSIKDIYKDIGFRGFYKGASSMYLFAGVVTAVQFETFQTCLNKLTKLGLTKGTQPSVLALILSGSITGAVCSFIYTPIEYAKIHSQIEHKPNQGSAAMIFSVLKDEKLAGLKKLYTGHLITLYRESIGSGLYYGGYHATLTRIFGQQRQEASTWAQLLSGGIAGIIYQLYTYPFDTVKTNIQSGKKTFKMLMHEKIWRTPNYSSGLKVSLLRSFIVDSVNFAVYENARHALLAGYKRILHQ